MHQYIMNETTKVSSYLKGIKCAEYRI